MPAGDAFTARQEQDIAKAIATAEQQTGLKFSVYVGSVEGDLHAQAVWLHRQLADADGAVLVVVDPRRNQLQIVTGVDAKRRVDDRAAGLAAAAMASTFALGDLAGGLVNGLGSLMEHAQKAPVLHADQP
ncbi:DUF5130 family protein [Catenulispora rubra]|uniref:DUF5130 family protein n=1 Tax=Catenulispora rubra TaxID=280293 RepID=UPI001891FC20|nr:DUF5130 family protein [Catenulispora rubra]